MAQNDSIYINRRLISEKWCSKPKYLSTLIDIAFDALPTGYIILTDLKCRPKKYLESVEARERRQSIGWLIRITFLQLKSYRLLIGVYIECLYQNLPYNSSMQRRADYGF